MDESRRIHHQADVTITLDAEEDEIPRLDLRQLNGLGLGLLVSGDARYPEPRLPIRMLGQATAIQAFPGPGAPVDIGRPDLFQGRRHCLTPWPGGNLDSVLVANTAATRQQQQQAAQNKPPGKS